MKTDYSQPNDSSQGLFHTANTDRLIVVTIEDIVDGTQLAYVHAIPNSYLLELTAKHFNSPIPPIPSLSGAGATSRRALALAFDDWAPPRTRLFERLAHSGFFFNVHGMRLIVPHYIPNSPQTHIIVYDFYQPCVRMLLGSCERPSNVLEVEQDSLSFAEPSMVGGGEEQLLIRNVKDVLESDPKLGENVFETCLPYVQRLQVCSGDGQTLLGTEVYLGEKCLVYLQVCLF
jgi:hypothetical protein